MDSPHRARRPVDSLSRMTGAAEMLALQLYRWYHALDRSASSQIRVPIRGHRFLALIFALFALDCVSAQSEIENRIRNRMEAAYFTDSLEVMDERIHAREVLRRVYSSREFKPFWITGDGLSESGESLAQWLEDGPRKHGLRPADYHLNVVDALGETDRLTALVDLELALSDAFLMLGSHFLAGRLNPETLDSEWRANRRHQDLAPVIEAAGTAASPGEALEALLPSAEGYWALVEQLARLRQSRAAGPWGLVTDGPTLRPGTEDQRVAELAERLLSTGEYSGAVTNVLGEDLTNAVVVFQKRHGLTADGLVGRATRAALNRSVGERIDQVIVNLERWRWLPESLGERYVLVNIADFNLYVMEYGERTLSMRVVVGRPYRRTPVFSGAIRYLVLNPYWEVPVSIAVQDKLPLIKADPDYLSQQGYTLLEGWGADERVIDSSAVDWTRITGRNFRYRLRQSPGPFNALGQVKFMFPNEFSVYLHDTPARDLFAQDSRSFSSGCIRLERPLDLAVLLLRGDGSWDRAGLDRAVSSGREQTVRLARPIPVHLLYWTAWVDDEGALQFREDIYGRDNPVLRELREMPPE